MSAVVGGLVAVALALGWLLLRHRTGADAIPFAPAAARPDESRGGATRTTRWIPTPDGESLEAWLYAPARARAPLVLLGPGLAATKEIFLERFAWRFAEAGFAALAFDYRTFGGSSGRPRHWVDPFRHAQDYDSALDYARDVLAGEGVVDPSRIALWGSSFSGGTVLEVAARRPEIAAVIAQAPYLAASELQRPAAREMARYGFWIALDRLRRAFGIDRPVYAPVFGRPGELAFARSRENPSVDGSFHPETAPFWREAAGATRGGWANAMLVRFLPDFDAFDPLSALARIDRPVLLVAATDDDLTPAAGVREAAKSAGAQLAELDCGHFALYGGDVLERNARAQIAFLGRALGAVR